MPPAPLRVSAESSCCQSLVSGSCARWLLQGPLPAPAEPAEEMLGLPTCLPTSSKTWVGGVHPGPSLCVLQGRRPGRDEGWQGLLAQRNK